MKHPKRPRDLNQLYQVVKAEAGPETREGELACRVSGGPLTPRDGAFVLKYFLLRAARRQRGWLAPTVRRYHSESRPENGEPQLPGPRRKHPHFRP
jgi:hypothetical protein